MLASSASAPAARSARCARARRRSRSIACAASSSASSTRPSASCSPTSTRSRSRSPRSARSIARARTTARRSRSRSSTPGVAEAIEADLRNLGLVGPIMKRLAPGVDAGAVLAEVRERISDELDYELEAQHQRRLERRFRGHPHVLVARVHTAPLDAPGAGHRLRRGAGGRRRSSGCPRPSATASASSSSASTSASPGVTGSSRATRTPTTACCAPTAGVGLLDFGLLRDLEPDYVEGERGIMRAIAGADAQGVHDGLSRLGYLPEPGRRRARRAARAPRRRRRVAARAGVPPARPGRRRPDRRAGLSAALAVVRADAPHEPAAADAAAAAHGAPGPRRCSATCAPAPTGARSPPSTMRARPPSTALGREDRAFFARRAR